MKLDTFWSHDGSTVIVAGRGVLLHLTKKQAAELARKLVRRRSRPGRGAP